jgi:hypothetical protein
MNTATKTRPGTRAKAPRLRAAEAPAIEAPPAAPAAPALFVELDEVLEMFAPIGPRDARGLTQSDPRFPPALFGRGRGKRAVWSRIHVQQYFQRLAEEGPPPS